MNWSSATTEQLCVVILDGVATATDKEHAGEELYKRLREDEGNAVQSRRLQQERTQNMGIGSSMSFVQGRDPARI